MSNTESKKKKETEKKRTELKINKLYLISFLLPVFVAILSFIICGFAPFGDKDILTANGNAGYITNYLKLYDFVHNNLNSSEIGDLYSFYMTDPTNIITLIFPRAAIVGVLSVLYVIKLGFASLLTTLYFDKKQSKNSKSNLVALLLSVAYSLSGFMLTYGTSISYLSVIVLLPLIVLFFEDMIYERKWLRFYIVLSISFISNVYTTFIVTLFLCLYLLVINYKNKKHIFDAVVFTFGSILLSMMSTLFVIIPVVNTNLSFFQKEAPYNSTINGFFDYFKRYLFLSEPSSITDTDYGIDLYLGLLGILLVIIYFVNPSFNVFKKIRVFLLIAILSAGTFMTGPNSILDFFANKERNSCHFTFCLIFLILILSYEVLDNIENIKLLSVILSGVLLEGLIIASLIFSHTYYHSNPFIYSIEIALVYTMLLVVMILKIKGYKAYHAGLLIIGILEIILTFFTGCLSLSKTESTYTNSYSFNKYAVEMNYKDSTILDYNQWDDYFNPVLNVINGYEYVMIASGKDIPDACLEFDQTIGRIDIYKNPNAKNEPIFVSNDILNWTYSKTSTYPSMNSLASIVSSKDIKIFNKIYGVTSVLADNYTDEVGNKLNDIEYAKIQYDVSEEGYIYTNYIRPSYLGAYSSESPIIKDHIIPYYHSQYCYFDNKTYYTFDNDAYSDFCNNIKYIENGAKAPENGYIIIPGNDKPLYEVKIDGKTITPTHIDSSLFVVPVDSSNSIELIEGATHTNMVFYIISIITFIAVLLINKFKLCFKLIKSIYNKAENICRNNYVYIISTIVPLMVVILSSYFWSCTPFGKTSAMASDGYVQTYPAIAEMIKSLNLKSLLPSTIGFGTLIYSSGSDPITGFISTLIQLFYRLFIWTNDSNLYTTIWATIYFVYSGPAIVFYFTHRYSGKRIDKRNPLLILIALLYSLCSYSVGYFIFNNFIYGLYTPIIIYALERLIYKKKPFLYIIALSFIMMRGYYSAFLLCEFIALFFITFDFKNAKDFITKALHFILSSLLAAGLAAFNLLPSFISTIYSPYRSNDSLSSNDMSNGINVFSTIFKTINQYQAGANSVVTSSDDGLVNIYAGLLPLLIIALFLIKKDIKLSIRIRKALICFIYIWAFGDSIFNFIFHGFHHQSNVPNRFAIFFVFLLITMFVDCIMDLKNISYKQVLFSLSTVSLLLTVIWLIYPQKNIRSLILSLVFIVIYLSTAAVCCIKNISKWTFYKLLVYTSTIEILISAMITFSVSIGHINNSLENNIKSIGVLNTQTKTDDIYISEYLTSSTDNFNMGKINGLNTFTGFNSGLSTQASDLANFWGLSVSNNTINYITGNPLADMMMHLKYQYIDSDDDEYGKSSPYTLINTHNNIEQYENPYFLPLGYVTNPELKQWSESDLKDYSSYMDYQNEFSRIICGKDLYTEILPPEDNSDAYIYSSIGEKSLYGRNDLNVELKLQDEINGKIYVFYNRRVIYIGDTEKAENNTFYFTLHSFVEDESDNDVELIFGVLNEDVLAEIHDILSESTVSYYEKTRTNVSGEINVKKDGILYLAIPAFDSTEIYVDGVKAETFDYMCGIGINISKGDHIVSIRGTYGNYSTGCIVSIIFILLIILYLIILKIYKKKHPDNTDESDHIIDKTEVFDNEDSKKSNNNSNDKHNNILIKTLKKINKTYLLAFIIPFLVLLVCFVYSGFAPFGARDVMTANEQGDYLLHYFELYDRFHSGKSILGYSLYEGTGYDFTTLLTYFLSDPTNLLILLFSRNDIISVVNLLYILKLSLSGLFMSIYLKNSKMSRFLNTKYKGPKAKKADKKDLIIGGKDTAPKSLRGIMNNINLPIVAFSLMYSLSNYMLGPGFNTAMLGAVCILPLIMLGMDKLIYEGKKKLYIITYFISFILNFRITVITTIFLLLYLILPRYKNIKHFFVVLKNKIISDIIVFLGAAYIIINNCTSTFWHNEITSLSKNEITANLFDTVKMMTTGIKPANILLAGNNTYLYSGIIALLFLLVFIFNNKISLSIRIRYAAAYALLFMGFMMTSLNTVLNGFIFFDGISSTYAYTIIFLGIVIVYAEYRLIGKTQTIRIVLPALICSSLIVGAIFLCYSYNSPSMFIKSLEFIFFYTIIILVYSNNSLTKWLMKLLVSGILIIELISSFIPNFKALSWLTYPYTRTVQYKEMTAIDYTHDNLSPNSVLLLNTLKSTHTPLEIALKGHSYVIWDGNEENTYKSLELVNEDNDLKIYKISGAKDYYIIDENIKNYSYNKYSPLESINELSQNYLHTPLSLKKIDYTELGGNYAYYTNMIYVESSEPGDLFYNYSYITNRNDQSAGESIEFTQYVGKNRDKYIKGLYGFSKENYDETMNSLEGGYCNGLSSAIENNKPYEINVQANGNKYMTLGLKSKHGWNIKVNNNKVQPHTFLDDAMIIPLNNGNNIVSISYSPILFYIGLTISVVTIIILCISSKILKKKTKKDKSNKETKEKE
ncbi:MAG: YfhO family protein [Eubacterium sp.]|nr:YfhO family protein [Eubacterium sp.]